jgi:hypothetical protein
VPFNLNFDNISESTFPHSKQDESQIKLNYNNHTDWSERLRSAVHRIEGLARAFVSEF